MFVCILLFLQLWKFVGSCPPEYIVTDPNHSYCSNPYPGVADQRVTALEREHILRMHNYERQLVRGANMERMYWNDELAEIALRYARACVFDHDTAHQRSVPKIPLFTGQNLAMGYDNWTQALEGWIEEKEHYFYGYPSTGIVAHYTQMIWHSAVLVGCAATMCPPYGPYSTAWPFYVCNYVTGQLNSNIHMPYRQGTGNQPLYDCQGKVCLYNGTLDLNTCQCKCSTYASGFQCEHLDCSKLPSCPYYSSESCIAVNVPLECPRLCGLCERYEVLKQVYGKTNLAPNVPAIQSSLTTTTTSTKKLNVGRKLKKKTSLRPSTISTTEVLHTTTIRSTKKKTLSQKSKKPRIQVSKYPRTTTSPSLTTNAAIYLSLSIYSILLYSIIIICD